MSNYKKV
ncbi:UNVERIFIED_CONTAM: hypothetical protein GTU68_053314 [Idotea baltica]|nr:hypothetical protein [Idotea baltica]